MRKKSSFIITIYKDKEYRSGWQTQAIFSLSLHPRDLPLLKKIQAFFGVGTIKVNKSQNTVMYCVADQKQLMNVIIPHFDKYPLLTKKRADFILFKSIVKLILNKEHLTTEGLNKIISIRASMNYGLSKTQIEFFPNIMPVDRPKIETTEIPDPN